MPTPTHKPTGLVFDVDKTLTEKTTWLELTEKLGGDPSRHAEIFSDFLNYEVSYDEMKKDLFKLWNSKGKVHRDQIKEICRDVHLKGEAFATFNALSERGYDLCLISGSFDIFVEIVAERFGIKCWKANSTLIFDDQGYWVDVDYDRNEAHVKEVQLDQLINDNHLSTQDIIAIGDSDNDVEIFKMVPGIAIHTDSDLLKQLAWKEIDYLPRIVQVLESLPNRE